MKFESNCMSSINDALFSFLRTAAIIAEVRLQRPVPWFYSSKVLRVPKGHYVELNFAMGTSYSTPCLDDIYLEVRDGYKKTANLLGVFCGARISSIVRSSGHYMWLKFSLQRLYRFRGIYSGKAANVTGKCGFGEINNFLATNCALK